MSPREAILSEAKAELWRRGNLRWKMHPVQQRMYDAFHASKSSRHVFECSRRLGKSWLLCLIALETCLRNPGCNVVYGAPTTRALLKFVIPALEALSADAPDDVRGRYVVTAGEWQLPNRAKITLFGADDKPTADRGRGTSAHLAIADEAGFFPVELLTYILKSIFKPQMQLTKGRTIVASTPSALPDHDFTIIAERAEADGYYSRFTIHDNPMLSEDEIAAFIAADAREEGMAPEEYQQTDTFRREYLAERVVDKLLVVIPEWARVREVCIRDVPRPAYFDAYTTLDFGGADPHAATFGYWHFELAVLVITGELLLRKGENTAELVGALKAKEREQWGVEKYDGALRIGREDPRLSAEGLPDWLVGILEKEAPQQPYSRVCDNDLQLARDLYELHGMAFLPTRKDSLELQVNNLRLLAGAGKLIVSPSCVHTDRHLRSTTWSNHKRNDFSRKAGEHGDLLATLIYKARNIDRQRNPTPEHLRYRPPTLAALFQAEKEAAASIPDIFKGTRLGRRLSGQR